ncbi:MAG TPA: nucleotide sugar dehydrogenase [Dehalococcoidia bacterium]|nr:nucleotide sugar dehydrogenase [Dehalococcoidia bacterium]
MQNRLTEPTICIIGLGYVGLPLAEAFSCHFKVIGFDTNIKLVKELRLHNNNQNLTITGDPHRIKQADFIIITVPTPVTKSKEPDLSHIENASKIVSQNMKAGGTVVLESTVYPGVTEGVVKPILEESGLKCGQDFKIAYSPERINPGDEEHTIGRVTKVVSGMDKDTTELVAELYGRICPEVFKAKDIKTAEAAKVIENIQRDLNIALVNELRLIFERMGLTTKDVLDAAATKWNFHRYSPGLVGGHCIPVDPYYLVYKAKELGYHPQVILAGRAINDYMPRHIAQMTIKALNDVGKVIRGSRVLIMGLTYKENVADTRESPVKDIIKELEEYGVEILGYDPLLNNIEDEFGVKAIRNLEQVENIDCLVLTVVHDAFKGITLGKLKDIMNNAPVLIDVRGFFNEKEVVERGFYYRAL